MTQELLAAYKANQAKVAEKFMKQLRNPFLFRLFLLIKLPMAFMAGTRVKYVDMDRCEITVPYRWMNQNPFKSTYFAVLAMAGEMSTGMIALMYTQKSKPYIAMLVTNLECRFVKKATGLTTFKFEGGQQFRDAMERAILTGEGQTVTAKTIGYSAAGVIEAEFDVTWSFKAKVK